MPPEVEIAMSHRVCVSLAVIFLSLPTLAQDLTPAQTAERCENNRARLAELRRQADALPLMSPFAVKQIVDDVLSLGGIAAKGDVTDDDMKLIRDLAVRYKFSLINCLNRSQEQCGIELLDTIQKAERQNTLNQGEYTRLQDEMRSHEVNLVALACDAAILDVAGEWNSNWGAMHLEGSGTIEGTFDYQGGRVYGTMTGNVLSGKWSQTRSGQECKHPELGSKFWGQLKFVFDAGGNSFTGDWSYCEADVGGGDWTGTKLPTP